MKSYGSRSKFVHGNKSTVWTITIVVETEDLLEQSLALAVWSLALCQTGNG